MPIEFQCSCGRTLRVKDEMAGKRAKCPGCEQALTVPSEPVPAEQDDERPKTVVIPVRAIITVAVLAIVLGAGYFLGVKPLLDGQKMSEAYRFVRIGDMEGALEAFEALRPQLGGRHRDKLDLWDSQCRLELEKNPKQTLTNAIPVLSDVVEMTLEKGEPSGGAIILHVTLRNKGKEPLTVRNDFFYLRGVRDIVPVASHSDNSLDGVVVPPGETREGVVAFRSMPHDPVMVSTGLMRMPVFHMYFNDGERYVKVTFPL